MADFLNPCSICKSYSQASLYHYTLKQYTLFELAFARLRYSLGGSRPS